jgi:hypothetical protein
MQRAVTAIYRTYSVADLVRSELKDLGISSYNVTIVPDSDTSATGSTRDLGDQAYDKLHDLHLPESDIRTYQQAVRNGDYVVSVNVDDEAHIERVKEIMRRPEDAHDINSLDTKYASEVYKPRRDPLTEGYDERHIGRRESTEDSPYTRSYSREQPIKPRDGF